MAMLRILRRNLTSAGIKFSWNIPDLHDECMYRVKLDDAELAMKLHRESVEEVNHMLGGVVKLKMTPKLIKDLSERKD